MEMKMEMGKKKGRVVGLVVREYDRERDGKSVEEVERRCEVGPHSKMSLFTDLLGDPLGRIRHAPAFLMLVAEWVEEDEHGGQERRELVGMIRGCIQTVTCGQKFPRPSQSSLSTPLPVFTKLAYILGLRVAPSHRRLGIAEKLVNQVEDWFVQNGAEYSYLATEMENQPSISLFTHKCGYSKFRTPSLLVQPVYEHRLNISKRVNIFWVSPSDAESLYRRKFSTTEFFPRDIEAVLHNRLSLGTFVAVPRGFGLGSWPGAEAFLSAPPETWAVVSVWNCSEVWRLEVRGASRVGKGLAKTSRVLDRALPFLKIPSFPEVFRPFGLHFMYGLGGEGPELVKYVKELCRYAHNLAREKGCSVVAAEVGSRDPVKMGIPHWKKLSCDEDLWCIKRLGEDYRDGAVGDWTKSPPPISIFVDPREF